MGRSLARRALAEGIGTGLLVTAVVGSGIMASRLSSGQIGLMLLENSTATAFALGVLILALGPVSGAHFNPVISLADWWVGRRHRTGLQAYELGVYIGAQLVGGVLGSILANVMFGLPAVTWATTSRSHGYQLVGEGVATAGLVLLVFALARTHRTSAAPAAVGAYIGAAYWFTSSTSFANPAVTVGRAFTNTFAGIAPGSVPGFIGAQFVGLIAGLVLLVALYPHPGRAAGEVVVPTVPATIEGDRHRRPA